MFNLGNYSKFAVSLVDAALVGMEPYYGKSLWFQAAIAGLGALLVYLVPNVNSRAAVDAAPKVEVSK